MKKLIFLMIVGISSLAFAGSREELNLSIDEKVVDRVTVPVPTSFAPMLKSAKQSVVAVYTSKVVKVMRGGGMMAPNQEFLYRFFGLPMPHNQPMNQNDVEERRVPQGMGSGVIISENGYIITNNHVVTDERGDSADEVLVRLNDGRELPASIIGRDPKTDIAILKIEEKGLPAIKIADSDNIEVGDIVFAIGNPMGVGMTVTQGIVSAMGRSIGIYGEDGYENFIQTDASINPGNSGGALVDTEGRLIGVNSAILSRTGSSIGIGFAIPSNLAVSVVSRLSEFGEVKRGFLGIQITTLTPDVAEAFDVKIKEGVLVNKVEEGSFADKAGIKRGDIIISIDGKLVRTANELRLRVGQTVPGSKIAIKLYREGKEIDLESEVGEQNAFAVGGKQLFDGVSVSIIDDEMRQRYGIPQNVSGLVVTEVDNASPYSREFNVGMAIVEINDQNIRELSEAHKALRKGVNKIYVYDRGRAGYMAIRVR